MLFYHLERDPLENVLPQLLQRSLERGWRCVVQAGSRERVAALNDHLWTWRDESFLPHGVREDGTPERQPIFLTDDEANPNAAAVRFLVDGARLSEPGDYQRLVYMFDGADPDAVQTAREMWKWGRSVRLDVTYWQQGESGRWNKKA